VEECIGMVELYGETLVYNTMVKIDGGFGSSFCFADGADIDNGLLE